MYQGRYQNNGKAARKPARRRKLNKYFLVTLSLFLLLGVAGGATLAYIVDKGETVENSFTPGVVQCEVSESSGVYSVKNTGTVDEFLRVAVIVNWESSDGSIYAFAPTEKDTNGDGDYAIVLASGWGKNENDGFYYYTGPVSSGTTVSFATITDLEKDSSGTYDLCIEVLAEAIQAEGMGASSAQEAWAMVMPATGN